MHRGKRFFSIITVLVIIVSLIANIQMVVQSNDELVFSNPIFTKVVEGEPSEVEINKLEAGLISFSLDVSNSGAEKKVVFAMALYKGNELMKVVLYNKTVRASETLRGEIEVHETYSDVYKLKVFIWDNTKSLIPLSNVYMIVSNANNDLIDALAELDKKFDKSVMDWCISMYDPIEGGFYFAASARDNQGFAADIESTAQMVGIMDYMGIITPGNPPSSVMPQEIKDKLVNFMQVRQDPDDGYFYDKQFGKNVSDSKKARNLSMATSIIRRFGGQPLYPTPIERMAQNNMEITLYEDEEKENTDGILPAYLQSEEAFLEWLDERPWDTNVYGAGANLSAIASLIKAAGLWETAVEYVKEKQNPETGLWGEGLAYINVNAAMKLRGFFANSEPPIPMPYIDKVVENVIYVVKNETPSTAAEVWNPIILLRDAIKSYGGEFPSELKKKIDDSMVEMVNVIAENMDKFRQPDNGYSWNPYGSSVKSQGVTVSLGRKEGDVNGTNLIMMARQDCYRLMGVEAPLLWESYRDYFWDKIFNAEPIVKNALGCHENFEGTQIGELPNGCVTGTTTGSVGVYFYPNSNENKALKIVTEKGGSTWAKFDTYSGSAYQRLVLEYKILISESDICDLLYNSIGTTAVQTCFISDKNGIQLKNRTSDSGTGEYIATLAKGTWYNIKVEYEPRGLNDTVIRYYVDGVLKKETNHYYNGGNPLKEPVKNINSLLFSSFKNGVGTFYIDDVNMEMYGMTYVK